MTYTIIASGTNPEPVCNISILTLDASGRLLRRRDVDGAERAGFLAVSGDLVAAAAREDGTDAAGVPAKTPVIPFFIRKGDELKALARAPFAGENVCHVGFQERHHLVGGACYSSGDVSVWRYDDAGPVQELFHKNYNRPDRVSHPHCICPSPEGKWFYLVDLGLDQVTVFDCTPDGVREAGTLQLHPDDGPRHILCHPEKDVAWLITEYSNVVYTLRRDPETGMLAVCQRLSTLPDGYAQESFGASLTFDARTGKLYASNRGMNSVAVFDVLPNGLLRASGYASCGGVWPRHLALTKDGRFLLACNERSNMLCLLPIGADGMPGTAVAEIPVIGSSFALDIT